MIFFKDILSIRQDDMYGTVNEKIFKKEKIFY